MATEIIRAGSTVRVIVNPRGISDTEVVGGYLFITYTDGTVENAGYIGGGTPTPPPTPTARFAFNTASNSQDLGAL